MAPITLAIDTATRYQALALVDGRKPLARRLHRIAFDHSDTLLRNISDILDQQGVEVADLDIVAVGLGPGSFTGLRVGLANAKALARSAGAEIVGVSSLAAIARPASYKHDGVVVSAIDARRGEVYTATFGSEGGFERLDDERTARPEALRETIEELAERSPVVVVGDALQRYPDLLATWPGERVRALDAPWHAPSSVSIAFLAQDRIASGGGHDLGMLEPNYIRPSDAKEPKPAPFGPES